MYVILKKKEIAKYCYTWVHSVKARCFICFIFSLVGRPLNRSYSFHILEIAHHVLLRTLVDLFTLHFFSD